MVNSNDSSMLRTTHYPGKGRPHALAKPIVINGKRCLAYYRGNAVESYIPWEDVQAQVDRSDLPEIFLDF